MKKHAFRPALENLEGRWVPATIKLIGGNLFISNQVGTLAVSTTAAGKVLVNDSGSSPVLLSGVGGLIQIVGTNKSDQIKVDTTAKAFPGSLIINSKNGNDTLQFKGDILGNVTVVSGLGDDVLQIKSDVKVGGSLTYVGGTGSDQVKVFSGNTLRTGGDLTAVGVTAFQTQDPATLIVSGSLTVSSSPNSALPLLFQTKGTFEVGGNLGVTGGNGVTTVNIKAETTIGGNATLNLGGGNNVVNLSPTVASSIGGNLSITAGFGDNDVVFGANLAIDGNAIVNLGDGNNDFDTKLGNLVAGNLYLTVGNGDNLAMTLAGSVAGNLSLTQGNGTNANVTISDAPGGTLFYQGGNGGAANGDNRITLTGAGTYLVNMVYGTGFGGLRLNNAALVLNGIVVGTGGTYQFLQDAGTLSPNLSLINFP